MLKGEWNLFCPGCASPVTPVATDETKPLTSNSIYAISKKDQEEMCLNIGRAYNIPTVALRYFNVYGPRQSLSNPYTGVAAIFMSRIKNDHEPFIYEDGLQSRDFISVHDIVSANMLAMTKDEANYEMFNVGTGVPIAIKDIALTLAKLYGKNITPNIANKFRKGDVRYCYADITKIKKLLGFTPKISFEQGMKELIEWARVVEAEDNFEKAAKELKEKGLV
jgi:dTDP-L-rhamnose 4-epimerase